MLSQGVQSPSLQQVNKPNFVLIQCVPGDLWLRGIHNLYVIKGEVLILVFRKWIYRQKGKFLAMVVG